MPAAAAACERRRGSRRGRCRRPWRRPRRAAWMSARPTSAVSRRRRRRGPCTSRRTGTPCAAASRCRSGGTCCAPARAASTRSARWLRVFDFDVFFFGTATVRYSLVTLGCITLSALHRRRTPSPGVRSSGTSVVGQARRGASPASADQRSSVTVASHSHGDSLRSTPHAGQRPAQSSRHSGVERELEQDHLAHHRREVELAVASSNASGS